MEALKQTGIEQIQEQAETPELQTEGAVRVSGGEELQASLGSLANSFNVRAFKCVKCGLAHEHDTVKHRVSDSFDISEEDAATDMEFNSVCHCGYNEVAARGEQYGIGDGPTPDRAFRQAPVSDSVIRALR